MVGPPPDLSQDGHRVTSLFAYTTAVTAFAYALVVLTLVFLVLRYRARPGRKPSVASMGARAELFLLLGLSLAVFFALDLVLVRRSSRDLEQYLYRWPTSPDTVRIEVMPQQWSWNVRYPGADGLFNTADDVVLLDEIRVPVGRPVFVSLKSKDVVHGFYVPQLRLKQDANPGQATKTWFQAVRTGELEIACSQMCGWAHYKMKGRLLVVPDAEFERWYADAQEEARRRFDPADREALWGWPWP